MGISILQEWRVKSEWESQRMGAISDITQPDAVKQAMAEYDRIGKDDFLRKYGYGTATKYFLKDEGKLYDSKAIVGVAYPIRRS